MQTNKTNNIVFLKNIESNIIEEAIVILKKNIKLQNFENKDINKNIDILKEAELVVNQKISSEKEEFSKFRINRLERKIKKLKILNFILIFGLILVFIF